MDFLDFIPIEAKIILIIIIILKLYLIYFIVQWHIEHTKSIDKQLSILRYYRKNKENK